MYEKLVSGNSCGLSSSSTRTRLRSSRPNATSLASSLVMMPEGKISLVSPEKVRLMLRLSPRAPLARRGLEPTLPQAAKVADAAQITVEELAGVVQDEADVGRQQLRLELGHLPAG